MLDADAEVRTIMALRAIRSNLLRLKWLVAATRFEMAMRRHDRALKLAYKYGFNPDQPRVPAGDPDGGQWTDESNAIALPEIVVTPEDGDGGGEDISAPYVQLAGDLPTGDSPELPEERPPKASDRTAALKLAARLLGPVVTVAKLAKYGAWFVSNAAQIISYNDPPKTLEELQKAASTPTLGYDVHHIVEQNQRSYFSSDIINGPDNLVLVPRLRHQEINAWYQTKNPAFGGESPREYLDGRNWGTQRAIGLEALKEFGVLKP